MKKTNTTAVKPSPLPLENLVEELLKPNPCQDTVKDLMRAHGIEYIADPIHQLNSVLMFINKSSTLRGIKEKESIL